MPIIALCAIVGPMADPGDPLAGSWVSGFLQLTLINSWILREREHVSSFSWLYKGTFHEFQFRQHAAETSLGVWTQVVMRCVTYCRRRFGGEKGKSSRRCTTRTPRTRGAQQIRHSFLHRTSKFPVTGAVSELVLLLVAFPVLDRSRRKVSADQLRSSGRHTGTAGPCSLFLPVLGLAAACSITESKQRRVTVSQSRRQ